VLTPAMLGRLRQTIFWPRLQRLHRRVGPPLCWAVHTTVRALGPDRVPAEIFLKHRYDYEVVYIDPHLIERSLHVGEWARPLRSAPGRISRFRRWFSLGGGWKHLQRHLSRNVHGRFVVGGDWDLQFKPFTIRQSVVDLFVDGMAPEETVEYRKMQDWVAKGEFGWTRGCRTAEDVDRYFAEMTALFDRIRTDGYLTQRELGLDGADEIRVCIDRDGRPCVFGGGTHRLSIALLVGLPRLPVIVKRVHADWVQRCRVEHGTTDVHVAVARGLAALSGSSPPDAPRLERTST
jgi:hypothetical protein